MVHGNSHRKVVDREIVRNEMQKILIFVQTNR